MAISAVHWLGQVIYCSHLQIVSLCLSVARDGVLEDCPRARGQLEDPKSWPWPWPLTVPALALASKWSGLGLGLGLDASAPSHLSVINVLNL